MYILHRIHLKVNEWGMLQYYDKLSEGENGKEKVDLYYNCITENQNHFRLRMQ